MYLAEMRQMTTVPPMPVPRIPMTMAVTGEDGAPASCRVSSVCASRAQGNSSGQWKAFASKASGPPTRRPRSFLPKEQPRGDETKQKILDVSRRTADS
jgi:hypothetical protein